jgi:hypothetical protein
MNQQFALGLVAVLLTQNTFADGLPVDPQTHKITVPHSVVRISDSQREEIDVLGTITFSQQQLESLRNSFPRCPKRIQHVFPITFSDSIEAPSYAIQVTADSVAIVPASALPIRDYIGTQFGLLRCILDVDRRGQFYVYGILVPFNQVLKMVEETKGFEEPKEEERKITISLPFGMKRDDSVVKSRIDQILKEAKKAGAGIRVYPDL